MLTGKCKEDFEQWYSYHIYSETHHVFGILLFYKLPFSMQYGVYVDFFDSVGVCVDILYANQFLFWEERQNPHTIHEARTKAIEKANEIYNNQNQIK